MNRSLTRSVLSIKRYLMLLLLAMSIVSFDQHPASAGETTAVEPMSVRKFDEKIKTADADALVVVLASWCAPCRKELPIWVDLYGRYRSKGLNLMGMSIDYGGVDAIQPIVDRYGVSFPVYWVGEKGIEAYNISAVPVVMVVRGGKIADRIVGIQTRKQLEKLVHRVID